MKKVMMKNSILLIFIFTIINLSCNVKRLDSNKIFSHEIKSKSYNDTIFIEFKVCKNLTFVNGNEHCIEYLLKFDKEIINVQTIGFSFKRKVEITNIYAESFLDFKYNTEIRELRFQYYKQKLNYKYYIVFLDSSELLNIRIKAGG